jgi:alkyl hydroperoxide reductase subunit F
VGLFREEDEQRVRELLAELERPVELVVMPGPESGPLPGAREVDFAREARRVCEELAALADRLTVRVTEDTSVVPVERFPAIAVLPEGEDVDIRYYGLPWGYELSSLVGACLDAGRREPPLSEDSRAALARLDRDLALDVFVTPT